MGISYHEARFPRDTGKIRLILVRHRELLQFESHREKTCIRGSDQA